jgi:hypothetical protein
MRTIKTKAIAAAIVLSLPLLYAWWTRADAFTTTLNVEAIRTLATRRRHELLVRSSRRGSVGRRDRSLGLRLVPHRVARSERAQRMVASADPRATGAHAGRCRLDRLREWRRGGWVLADSVGRPEHQPERSRAARHDPRRRRPRSKARNPRDGMDAGRGSLTRTECAHRPGGYFVRVPGRSSRRQSRSGYAMTANDLRDRVQTSDTPNLSRAMARSDPSSVSGRTLAVQNHSVAKGRREQGSAAAAQQPAAAVAIRCTPLTSKAAGHETTGNASLTRSKPPLRL